MPRVICPENTHTHKHSRERGKEREIRREKERGERKEDKKSNTFVIPLRFVKRRVMIDILKKNSINIHVRLASIWHRYPQEFLRYDPSNIGPDLWNLCIRALSAHLAAEFNILLSRWKHFWLMAIVHTGRWGKMDRNDCHTDFKTLRL
jgi:hypothetical protein